MTTLSEIVREQRETLAAQFAAEADRHRYQSDPVAYCQDVLHFQPWSKQQAVLESVRDHPRTAIRSCHGVGKTAIAARCALWFLDTFPDSLVVTTAPTWPQVRDLLWRELHAGHTQARMGGNLSVTRLELPDGRLAVGYSTDRPERFQGYHATNLLLIFDEASGVDERIFEAGEGYLTAGGARILLIGNPTQISGSFYQAFHAQRGFYSTISISAFDAPAFTGEQVPGEVARKLISREWVEEHLAMWGETSPLYQVRVLGEFPSTADDSVMGLGNVETAQNRMLVPNREGPAVVACDVARFGSDETVIALRRGKQVRIHKVLNGKDLMHTVGEVVQAANLLHAEGLDFPVVVIDDAGLGGGVTDRLKELQRERAFKPLRIVAFNGAEKPRRAEDYPNRRSELWFAVAEMLPEIDLDADEQLAADLLAPKFSLDSRGRRVVETKAETKKRLGRSPDRGDTVLMCFAHDYKPARKQGLTPADTGFDADRELRELRRHGGGRVTGIRRGMSL